MKLPINCDCGCKDTQKRNIVTEVIDGDDVVVEYSLYCTKCGRYLGSFSYGHWEY